MDIERDRALKKTGELRRRSLRKQSQNMPISTGLVARKQRRVVGMMLPLFLVWVMKSMVYYPWLLISFLLVNGVQKPFSEVTEEDQELMTPDEYTAYFEVFQAHS